MSIRRIVERNKLKEQSAGDFFFSLIDANDKPKKPKKDRKNEIRKRRAKSK